MKKRTTEESVRLGLYLRSGIAIAPHRVDGVLDGHWAVSRSRRRTRWRFCRARAGLFGVLA